MCIVTLAHNYGYVDVRGTEVEKKFSLVERRLICLPSLRKRLPNVSYEALYLTLVMRSVENRIDNQLRPLNYADARTQRPGKNKFQ